MADAQFVTTRGESLVSTHKVLKNTYMLLSMTLLFSAIMAGVAMATNAPPLGYGITLIGFFGLLFLTHRTANSGFGIVSVFMLTGFMGYTLGPLINMIVGAGGSEIVVTALGLTGVIFLSLSAYTLMTKKDFSFLSGFLMMGFWVLVGCMALMLFDMVSSAAMLAMSVGFIIFASSLILYQTSAIIHGGETNYILATVTLYVSLYNIFVSLLNLLTAFGGDD